MTKIVQTKDDLENHLKEQINFLKVSAERFDSGDDTEAKRIATHIRTLLHDTPKSQSLLKLLDLKERTLFLDSSSSDAGVVGPYTGLVLKAVGSKDGKYLAPLDDVQPFQTFKEVDFETYWNKDIFVDDAGNHFSRKKLILAIANKDGGAHVDPSLDKEYLDLARDTSLGWFHNGDPTSPLRGACFAAVRQIGHEVLKTLVPNYPEKKLLSKQSSAVFGDLRIFKGLKEAQVKLGVEMAGPRSNVPRVGRNEKCLCGSGLKYKKCHGK